MYEYPFVTVAYDFENDAYARDTFTQKIVKLFKKLLG